MARLRTFLAFFLLLATVPPTGAWAAPGHGASTETIFRIADTQVTLSIVEATGADATDPSIHVLLTEPGRNAPVLDADLRIRLTKTALSTTTLPDAAGKTTPDTGAEATGNDGFALDFGDGTEDAPPTVDLESFTRLLPMKKAGMFSAVYPLDGFGTHEFSLAVLSLNGHVYAEPVVLGGILLRKKPTGPFPARLLTVFGIILLSALVFRGLIARRLELGLAAGESLNLLEVPWIRKLMLSPWFQPAFQIPTALFFLLIIYFGLTDIQAGDKNIATILMWTIWWAAIIFTFVFAGRVWCLMCPYGAAQDVVSRTFSLGKRFPKALRNIWLSTLLFFLITWWDTWSGIVNKPAQTAWLLIGFFVVAFGMSLVFRGRTFCRYVCPIGGLIGIYSMFSPLELRNRCLEVCRKDKVKGCMRGTDHNVPCPMFETPMTMDRNNYCNFCSECIKGCAENNIAIRFRSFAKDLWGSAKGYLDEAFLAVALMGLTVIVTAEMLEPWHLWMDAFGKILPLGLLGELSHATKEKVEFTILLFLGSFVVPMLILLGASTWVRRATGPDSPLSLGRTFIQFAYMFIPVGIGMHLSHNISHLFKEGPLIVPALRRVAHNLFGIGSPVRDWNVAPLMGPEAIYWLQMLILMVLNGFSLYAGYRIATRYYEKKALRAFVPMAVLAVSFMLINAYVLGQPMALRHTH